MKQEHCYTWAMVDLSDMGATVAAMGAPIGMIVYARNRTASALKAYIVFAIVNIGLDAILIPRLQLPGALIGLGTAKFVAVLLMSRIAWSSSTTCTRTRMAKTPTKSSPSPPLTRERNDVKA